MTRHSATTAPVAADVEPDVAAQSDLDGTLQHIALLRQKQERLHEAQIEAEMQLLHRAGQFFAAGGIGELDLAEIYEAYALTAASGYMNRWNATIPIPAARMQYIKRNAPNAPDGTWFGAYPFDGGPVPLDGISVVYVLYDRENVPCYVGSTHAMRERLKRHSKARKSFVRWTAYRCKDRETAYQLEEKLLAEHQPYLNKKRYR